MSVKLAVKLKQVFETLKSHHKILRACLIVSPLLIYSALAWIFFGPSNLSTLHSSLFTASGDPEQFVWFLNWWPYSLAHHLNPFITHSIWYPNGYNLAWATSIPALAIMMAPITLLGGAVLSFNLIALLAPVLSALACFYLILFITKRYLPALLGGYIYGFSTYEFGQLLGHPHVYVNFLIPLIVLLSWLRLKNKINKVLFVILAAVLLVLQFGISTEIFATLIVFSALALVIFYFVMDSAVKNRIISLAKEFYFSTLLSLIILIPYIYYLVKGYKAVPSVLHPTDLYSVNVFNFVVPTPITQLGGQLLTGLAKHFTGNLSEDGAYIGLPLLIISLYIAIKYWHKAYLRALSILLVIIMLLALGPKLHIIGHIGGIPLPWAIASHLPLLKSALPDRFSMYLFLVIAIVIGLWLSLKTSRRNQSIKYAAVLIGIAFILPNTSQYSWTYVPVPPIFNKAQVNRYIKKGTNVIVLPYGKLGSSMYYQYESGMQFTQSGGYAGFTPTNLANNPVVTALFSGTPEASFDKDLQKFCTVNKVKQIIYLPGTAPALINAINSLGWPTRSEAGATVVTIPS